MKLHEAPLNVRVVVIERMDDEVRWTVYERVAGEAAFTPKPGKPTPFVRAIRHRMMQGTPGKKPRYDSGEVAVSTETDGRIDVVMEDGLENGPNHDWSPENLVERDEVREAEVAYQAFLAGLIAMGMDVEQESAKVDHLWAEYAPGYWAILMAAGRA